MVYFRGIPLLNPILLFLLLRISIGSHMKKRELSYSNAFIQRQQKVDAIELPAFTYTQRIAANYIYDVCISITPSRLIAIC